MRAVWEWMQVYAIPVIRDVWNWLATNLPPAIAALSAFWTNNLLPAMQTTWNWIDANVIPIVQAIYTWLTVYVPEGVRMLIAAWQAFYDKTAWVWESAKTIIDGSLKFFSAIWAAFRSAFEGDWYAFGENLRIAWDTLWGTLRTVGETAFTGLQKWFSEAITWIKDFVAGIDWGQVGSNIVVGIANGITRAIDWIIQAVISMGQATIDAIRGFLGIQSPSSVFADMVGAPMGDGIRLGLMRSLNGLAIDATATLNTQKSALANAGSQVAPAQNQNTMMLDELRSIFGSRSQPATAGDIALAMRDALLQVSS